MQVTDIVVTAAFMACGNKNVYFGVISALLILIPLVLTAVFLTRSQRKTYIERRLADEFRRTSHAAQFDLSGVPARPSRARGEGAADGVTTYAEGLSASLSGAGAHRNSLLNLTSDNATSAISPMYLQMDEDAACERITHSAASASSRSPPAAA